MDADTPGESVRQSKVATWEGPLQMPDRYYVEARLPPALSAEAHALFPTFDRAMAWLERRLGENSKRIGRFDTGAQLTAEHTKKLEHRKIQHFLG
jgi:hypothetical protein